MRASIVLQQRNHTRISIVSGRGGEPRIEHLGRLARRGRSQAHDEHVGIVPPPRARCGLRNRGRGLRAPPGVLVGRHADAGGPGMAEGNSLVGPDAGPRASPTSRPTAGHRASCPGASAPAHETSWPRRINSLITCSVRCRRLVAAHGDSHVLGAGMCSFESFADLAVGQVRVDLGR